MFGKHRCFRPKTFGLKKVTIRISACHIFDRRFGKPLKDDFGKKYFPDNFVHREQFDLGHVTNQSFLITK